MNKGQAAITDALIFVSIVGLISTLIITSAMDYGVDVAEGVQENYETTYLYSALKTIYVVNHGRDGNYLLENNINDYTMTLIKEQYSSLGNLTQTTKFSLFKILDQIFIMFPQKSYMLSILVKTNQNNQTYYKPLFVGIRTEGATDDGVYYLDCSPPVALDAISDFLKDHSLNQRLTSSNLVFFKNIVKSGEGSEFGKEDGALFLSFWTSYPDINQNNLINAKYDNYDLNCNIFTHNKIYGED